MVTGNHATVYFTQVRTAFGTQCRGKWATPMECAARWRIQWRGKFALERGSRQAILWIDRGSRGKQSACVGMTRSGEDGLLPSVLDRAAEIHDHDFIGDMTHHSQIV